MMTCDSACLEYIQAFEDNRKLKQCVADLMNVLETANDIIYELRDNGVNDTNRHIINSTILHINKLIKENK